MPFRTFIHGTETSQPISEASRTPAQLMQLSLHHLQWRQLRHSRAGRLEFALRRSRACPARNFNNGITVIVVSMTLLLGKLITVAKWSRGGSCSMTTPQ